MSNYRIYMLNPYTAEPERFCIQTYSDLDSAIQEVDYMVSCAQEGDTDSTLYAIYENGAYNPVYFRGHNAERDIPICEFQGSWHTLLNNCVDAWGVDGFNMYKKYYTMSW